MGTDCPYCRKGLTGAKGHEHIVLDAERPHERANPRYLCATCGCAWQRMHVGDGSFAWHRDPADPPRRFVSAFLATCPNHHSQLHTFRADHLVELIESREVMLWCGTCGASWSASDELLEKMRRVLGDAASSIDEREA